MQPHNVLMTKQEMAEAAAKKMTKPEPKITSDLPYDKFMATGDMDYYNSVKNAAVEQLKDQINHKIHSMESSLLEQRKQFDKTGEMLEPAMRSIIKSRQRMLNSLIELDYF